MVPFCGVQVRRIVGYWGLYWAPLPCTALSPGCSLFQGDGGLTRAQGSKDKSFWLGLQGIGFPVEARWCCQRHSSPAP